MSYTKNKGFVGLDNYLRVFSKSEYVGAMLLSLYYMAGAVVQLALALFFASILSLERIRGGGVYKAILFFPFLVNGIAIGYIFKFFYTRAFVLDTVLQTVGIPLESLPYWLRDQSINNWSLVFTSLWKYCGQNMILFIGAIASIDPTLYEAATIDGANRWQQTFHITIPGISATIIIMLILKIGSMLNVGFEKIILLYNETIYETSDVISSFVYRYGMQKGNYSYATAVGLFNSVFNFILLIAFNALSRKVSDVSLW
jgi:multiple sugar transport system permease protein